jgi:hypothetical protein
MYNLGREGLLINNARGGQEAAGRLTAGVSRHVTMMSWPRLTMEASAGR